MLKYIALTLGLLFAAVPQTRASLLIQFVAPDQTASDGGNLVFTATISNGGVDTVYLNSSSVNLVGNSFFINDMFISNAPISIDAGDSVSGIDLFDITLSFPFTDPYGLYSGTYAIFGGIDANATDLIGFADFTVTATTPEPSTFAMLAAPGLLFLAARRYNGMRSGRLLNSGDKV